MAFEAFVPKTLALQGDDALLEAYTWRRVFVVKKTVSGVETPVNMQEYDLVAPTIVFKNNVTESSGTTTGCPTGTCSWTNSAGGEFQVDVTAVATNPGSQVFTGSYEIYALHDTEEDSAGVKKRTMLFKGAWTVEKTVAAT
jgi:hypothetical protein